MLPSFQPHMPQASRLLFLAPGFVRGLFSFRLIADEFRNLAKRVRIKSPHSVCDVPSVLRRPLLVFPLPDDFIACDCDLFVASRLRRFLVDLDLRMLVLIMLSDPACSVFVDDLVFFPLRQMLIQRFGVPTILLVNVNRITEFHVRLSLHSLQSLSSSVAAEPSSTSIALLHRAHLTQGTFFGSSWVTHPRQHPNHA
jgi:hypothetical protein